MVGCKAIVDHNNDGSSPRCEQHKKKQTIKKSKDQLQRQYAHHYDDKGRNIYHTYQWKKLRARKALLNPICEHCELNGIATPVQEVDHIIEIEDGGEVWDIDNLQSLCKRHHKIKTDKAKAERNRLCDSLGYFRNI